MNKLFTTLGLSFLLLLTLDVAALKAQDCHPGFHYTVTGNTVTLHDTSSATGSIATYTWHFGDGNTSNDQNPVHTYALPGSYNVCLTIEAHNPGCTETHCEDIVINAVVDSSGCHAAFGFHQAVSGLEVSFADSSSSDHAITSWHWTFGDGTTSTSNHPTHTYAQAGTYSVCLIIANDHGCSDTACHDVTVTEVQTADCHAIFGYHQNATDFTVHYSDSSTSSHAIDSWHWSFGDGNTSTDQNPAHTYNHDGVYNVCLTITDVTGCTHTACHNITVTGVQAADCHTAFGIHQVGSTVHFSDSSTSSHAIVSWHWNFGDGNASTDQNPAHTYAQDGTYYVCLVTTDASGCTDTTCHHVTVEMETPDPCHAAFTFTGNGGTFDFTNTSTGTTTHTTYTWTFGDSTHSSLHNPTHTYVHHGQYTVCLFITDTTTGCESHVCHTVNYHATNPHHHHNTHHHGPPPHADVHHHGGNANAPLHIQGYPNPVNGQATVAYTLSESSSVQLKLFNLTGALVSFLVNTTQDAGDYSQTVDFSTVQPGIYYLQLVANGNTAVQKISVIQ